MAHTNSQKMALEAYARVQRHADPETRRLSEKYETFARSFPALVHTCGLAQAVAFGMAKDHTAYLADLAAVLNKAGHREAASLDALQRAIREQPVSAYMRLSRNALNAAGWLKRYAEAANPG